MDGAAIGLFIHVVGGLGLFSALGLEWTALGQIRNTILPDQVRVWMGIIKNVRRLLFVSMLLVVLTGLYPMVTEFGPEAWIVVSLASFALMIILAMALTGPRLAAIGQAMTAERRPQSQTFHQLASHPALWISIQTRIAIALGVVFLMLTKLEWVGSLLVIGVAILLGLVSTIPVLRRERVQTQSTD